MLVGWVGRGEMNIILGGWVYGGMEIITQVSATRDGGVYQLGRLELGNNIRTWKRSATKGVNPSALGDKLKSRSKMKKNTPIQLNPWTK